MSVWWVPQSEVACSGQGSSTERVDIRLGHEGWAILKRLRWWGWVVRSLGRENSRSNSRGGRRNQPPSGTSGAAPTPLEIKPADGGPARWSRGTGK